MQLCSHCRWFLFILVLNLVMRCFVPQFGLSGLVAAKSPGAAGGFGQGVGQCLASKGTSQVKVGTGQVLAKEGLQKSWHLFPWYMVTHLADRGTGGLT